MNDKTPKCWVTTKPTVDPDVTPVIRLGILLMSIISVLSVVLVVGTTIALALR